MTLLVPQSVLDDLDKRIGVQRRRVEAAQTYLNQLVTAREGMAPLATTPQAEGGHARAAALTATQRLKIARKAANARWSK